MKKLLTCLAVGLLIFPIFANAMILVASVNIIIIKNTVGGDGDFSFHLIDDGFRTYLTQNFNITTQNGSGIYTDNNLSLHSPGFYLRENLPDGWQLTSASCSGEDSSNTSVPITNGVHLFVSTFSTITCTFTNTKQDNLKTPVLIVPGMFGTELKKGDTLLWADVVRMVNPVNGDSFMDPLQFKSDLTPLDTSLSLVGVLRKKSFAGFNYDYIEGLVNLFTSPSIGYTEGKDLFTFPYDWRYGVSEDTVNQLKGQIDYILTQTDAGKAVGKVDVIAHSTGGLVVKRYVSEHPSDHHIGKAVFVGVPNLGAPKAFKALINGDNFDIPGLNGAEMKKLSQNMLVSYDLAPSAQYDSQIGSFLRVHNPFAINPGQIDEDANYNTAVQNFESQNLINTQGLQNGQNLHTTSFDNYDVRNNGVDVYNIVGCKTATFGKFTESVQKFSQPTYDFPKDTSGDGTVPLLSAGSIPADPDHTFFVPKAEHGKMPSASGIRQEIVNLLAGKTLDTGGKILAHDAVQQNPQLCQIKGESINIKSPVAINVTDQSGNFSGLADDGSIQNDIPGADYEVWGEHKYVFLPTDDNQTYAINLKGTDTGTFTVDDQSIEADSITQTQVFSNLPVTPALTGQVNLGSVTTLALDINGDGTIDQTIQPSAILDANQSQDITPPVSTSTIAGLMGQEGFYRSDVTINLSAADPVIPGRENETSGMLKTKYQLDSQSYQTYQSPISLTTEGQHTLTFFSTDKADNNEPEQTIAFTIDKTAPEANIQFNPSLKDIQFTGTDNLSAASNITVLDNDDVITLTDQAGNATQINLKDKDRKHELKAEIKSLSYNGVAVDLNKNQLRFAWQFDKQGNLQTLEQKVQSKKDFSIEAEYENNQTKLEGKDQTGKIKQKLDGLVLLQVATSQGDLNWSY